MDGRLKVFIAEPLFYKGVPALENLIESNWQVISAAQLKADPSLGSGLKFIAWESLSSDVIINFIVGGQLPDIKVVVNHGVGVNHLPFSLLKDNNIRVANTPQVLADATADMAMSLLMASARQLIKGYHWGMKSGDEAPTLFKKLELGQDVSYSTLGIVGMGSIGYKVAERAKAFNMKILYHNRNKRTEADEVAVGAVFYSNLMDMLPLCDFVVITCPMSESTAKLFKREQFQNMKSTSHLINIGRGGIVDTDSLVEALQTGQIHAAALDVTDPEPLPSDDPLLKLDNVLVVPHWGSATVQTRAKMIQLMIDNTKHYSESQNLLTEVHF